MFNQLSSFRYIGFEFYRYDEEELDQQKKIKQDAVKEVKRISKIGTILYILNGVVVSIILPILYYLTVRGEEVVETSINPFLPVKMYFPWNTYSRRGFITALVIQEIGTVTVVRNVIANGFAFVNLMVIYRSHFQVLNISVCHINKRAADRYYKKYGVPQYREDTYNDVTDKMKQCFYECLQQNIKHHQVLMR